MGNLGLRHAAVISRDLRRSLKFYCDVLGFEPYHTADADWAMVSLAGTTLSFLRVPPSTLPLNPPLKSGNFHPSHLGLTVASPEDVDLARQKMIDRGFTPPPATQHRDGSYGFYCADPDGNQLEIIFIPAAPSAPVNAPISGRVPAIRGVLLLAHGSADPDWRAPFERLLKLFRLNAPHLPTELGYMEFAQPDFLEAARRLVTEKYCAEITVIPTFMSSGGHVAYDVPALIEQGRGMFQKVRWSLQPALGEAPEVQEAMLQVAIARLRPGSYATLP